MRMTFYCLPISPSPSEFCGVDEQGNLYFHPGAISEALRQRALQDRVTVFVRIPAGIVPLVSFDWAAQAVDQDQLDLLDILKGAFQGFIKAGAPAYHYPLADISLPREPAFTTAVLRLLAGQKN